MTHDLRSIPASCSTQSFICQGPGFVDPERRHAMIAEAAYYAAERRGFAPGHEIDDWFEACSQIDAALSIDELHRLYGDAIHDNRRRAK